MSRHRLIPFTANVVGGIILEKPQLYYIQCPVISLGIKEYRGFYGPDRTLIKLRAFTIEYKKRMLASIHFNENTWAAYMAVMCQCCNDVGFSNDIEFLQNGGGL